MKDFYQKKIEEIKQSIKSNNKDLAMKNLQEELSMPYIPQKYEIQFQELVNELNWKKMQKIPTKSLTPKELIEFLNSKNQFKQTIAIDLLQDQNLRTITKELKQWVETNDNQIGKAFIYESLVSQEINISLNINGIKINPQVNKSFFDNEQVFKAFAKISSLVEKEPQLKEVVKEQLKLYVLLTFPHRLINGNKVAINIFNIVQFMVGKKKILSNEEKNIYKILKS